MKLTFLHTDTTCQGSATVVLKDILPILRQEVSHHTIFIKFVKAADDTVADYDLQQGTFYTFVKRIYTESREIIFINGAAYICIDKNYTTSWQDMNCGVLS